METENVMIFNHPLINHKIAILRDKETSMKEFREIVEEIASIMAYEAFRDAPTKQVEVETPLEKTTQIVLQEDKIVIVPILRAGLGMVNGIHTVLPNARVGHIGMYRDEETMQPKEYYAKFPDHIEDKIVVLLDPMLATGGSACAAIQALKDRGVKHIKLMSIIGAPEGIKKVHETHPDAQVYVATLDRGLNSHCYIVPGLGDAGDRIFGTK